MSLGSIEKVNYRLGPYRGSASVSFDKNEERGLFVEITTKRLFIRSVVQSDAEKYYQKIWGVADIMQWVSYGKTKTLEYVKDKIETTWLKRWKMNYPFSSLAIFEKSSGEFVGHVILRDYKEERGTTEIYYAICQEQQKKGYGLEAASSVIYEFLPKLVAQEYCIRGEPIRKVFGTARVDNVGSVKILDALLTYEKEEIKWDKARRFYSLDTAELIK